MCRITAIVNQKGGTGKTTLTHNLAVSLAEKGRWVLLIDFDPQANLTYSLGINEPEKTVVELLTGDSTLEEVIVHTERVDLIPGDLSLADLEISVVDHPDRAELLSDTLKGLRGYDFVFIDCPPSLSILTLNALRAAREVLIPLQMEVLALNGLVQLIHTVEEFRNNYSSDLVIRGIIAVKWDSRRRLSREIYQTIVENISVPLFKTVIRENVRITEAPSFGQSVLEYAPRSAGAEDYRKLALEYLQMVEA